jgi:hypothetical protein
MDRPNFFDFSDKNSPNIELFCRTLRFILAAKEMRTYWQNTVCVISCNIEGPMGGGKPPSSSNNSYLPDFSTILLAG